MNIMLSHASFNIFFFALEINNSILAGLGFVMKNVTLILAYFNSVADIAEGFAVGVLLMTILLSYLNTVSTIFQIADNKTYWQPVYTDTVKIIDYRTFLNFFKH